MKHLFLLCANLQYMSDQSLVPIIPQKKKKKDFRGQTFLLLLANGSLDN